jgi:predicted deacylase
MHGPTLIHDFSKIDFEKPGKHHYNVAFHHDSSWGYSLVPLTVINGLKQSQPRASGVAIFGGTHGNEWEGQVTVKRLAGAPSWFRS